MQPEIKIDNLKMPELKIQRVSAIKSRKSTSIVLENQAEESSVPRKRAKSKDPAKPARAAKSKKSVSPDKRRVTRSRTRSKSPGRKAKTASPKASRGAKLYIKKDLDKETTTQAVVKEPSPPAKEQSPITKKRTLRSASTLSSTSDLSLKLDESFTSNACEPKIESISARLNDSRSSIKLEEGDEPAVSTCQATAQFTCTYLKSNKFIIFNILFVTLLLLAMFSFINHLSINRDVYSDRVGVYLNSFRAYFANMIGLKAKFV